MPRKPTLRRQQDNISIFDYIAAETLVDSPYRVGDIVLYRRSQGIHAHVLHGIGVINYVDRDRANESILSYMAYTGQGYAGMLKAEHLELLARPSEALVQQYTPRIIFELVLGPGPLSEHTEQLLQEAWVLWNRLNCQLHQYAGQQHLYKHDVAQRERVAATQRRAETRIVRRQNKYRRDVKHSLPKVT